MNEYGGLKVVKKMREKEREKERGRKKERYLERKNIQFFIETIITLMTRILKKKVFAS